MHYAKKIMATVFWDYQGVLLDDFLTHETTINAASYCATLGQLQEAIHRKRPGLLMTGVSLSHTMLDHIQP